MNRDIRAIVNKGMQGDNKEMETLISFLKSNEMKESEFKDFVTVLKENLLKFSKEHEVFVGFIIASNWSAFNDDTAKLFTDFLTQLISSKTFMLKVCVRSLVKQFVIKSESEGSELQNLHRKFNFIHYLIENIVTIAPLASKFLSDAAVSFFPYIGKKLFILESYIVNMLQIISYTKESRYQILANLVDKLLSIDVRIPRSEIEEILEEENLIFQVDDAESSKIQMTSHIEIEKLDQLMCIMFTYIDSYCRVDGKVKWNLTKDLYKELLQIYSDVVLRTQQSSHVQFILFYGASLDKRLCKNFIDECWKIFENPTNAQVIRQASSSFLASFLARANFLDTDSINQQLNRMSEWIHRYLKCQDGDDVQPDYRKHAAFYSACQTIFYVFIYHHKLYVETSKGKTYVKSLDFTRIVLSKLNPLRYCLKSVVSVFARITRMYEIVFCYSTIEKNNRIKLISQNDEQEEIAKNMENFFPFDPYVLPKSKKFIEPLFHEWSGNHLDDEEDEDEVRELEENMDEIDELFESMEHNLGLHEYSNSRKSAQSFDMMCVSPGFSLHQHR